MAIAAFTWLYARFYFGWNENRRGWDWKKL